MERVEAQPDATTRAPRSRMSPRSNQHACAPSSQACKQCSSSTSLWDRDTRQHGAQRPDQTTKTKATHVTQILPIPGALDGVREERHLARSFCALYLSLRSLQSMLSMLARSRSVRVWSSSVPVTSWSWPWSSALSHLSRSAISSGALRKACKERGLARSVIGC